MNNFTFGDETMGYYETIAGGAGAGPTWHGASACQVHMTNTRITGRNFCRMLQLKMFRCRNIGAKVSCVAQRVFDQKRERW